MAGPDIFLSYNREDAEIARRFAEGFEAQGFDVWWDQALRSGEAYDKVTEAALRRAKAVVVLWSPRSVDSRWVWAEASIADEKGTLAPVKIEACDLPVMFRLTQTADLTRWQGKADDKAWLAFVGDVRRMVGMEAPSPNAKPGPAATPASIGIPVVAVLPLSHRGDDEELEFLAEDLTEDITRELASNRYFEVMAAGTMAAWRGRTIDYRALGRELDLRYLIEGKLQRAGENIRLILQLIDADTGRMLWSQRFARSISDINEVPEKFPVALATELAEHILDIERNRAMTKPGPYSAWEHMLRAMAYTGRLGTDSMRRGEDEARQPVAAAPDLGFPYALLAVSLAGPIIDGRYELDAARSQEIRMLLTRAMQLDGDNPLVIAWLGTSYAVLGDEETALLLAQRAVEMYPNSPTSHLVLGLANMELGRTLDAIETLKRFESLVAHDVGMYIGLMTLGICYLLEGQPAEAEEAIDRSLALHPDYYVALKWKAILAELRGKKQAALAAVRRLREIEPEMSIDQHARQILRIRHLAERATEPAAILRRLWAETESEAKSA